MKLATVLLALFSTSADAVVLRGDRGVKVETAQCHQRFHRRVLTKSGRVQATEQVVVKDGYFLVGCEKDRMYYDTPKDVNVSVVHYKEEVPSEDRKPMTPKEYFSFCRTQPGMGFFGVAQGRDCYCTPYFENVAGDDSQCDSVCEGDKTQVCGSLKKSSVYEMHACGSEAIAKRLKEDAQAAEAVADELRTLATEALKVAGDLQKAGNDNQELFAPTGDFAASRLMQAAKVAAGVLQHAAEAAEKAAGSENETLQTSTAMAAKPTEEEAKEIFPLQGKVRAFRSMAEAELKTLHTTLAKYSANFSDDKLAANASNQYYSVLYFTDKKEYQDNATTCSGKMVGEPKIVKNNDECALSCDAEVHDCVGYTLVGGVCILFSNFKEASYYTKCDASVDPFAKCYAKFSEFSETTLSPDSSGKCKECMRTLTIRESCYNNATR